MLSFWPQSVNPELLVIKLPKNVDKIPNSNPPKAYHKGKIYYRCRDCQGWIEGNPSDRCEDTSGPLCGRQGTATFCIRCGAELAFFGKYF